MLCLMHHLTGAASAGLHGHADFSRAPRPGRSQQSKCHRASGPSRALLAFSSGLSIQAFPSPWGIHPKVKKGVLATV